MILSKMNLKRPKIAQQILSVLFVAVLIPLITIGIIISNVSQHSVRRELNYSAKMISQFVGENISVYKKLSIIESDEEIAKIISERFKGENRQIYVLDENKKVIASNTNDDPTEIIAKLPTHLETNKPELFNKIKNQPMVYYKMKDSGWIVIVNTTEKITKNTINLARFRIILSLTLAAIFIILVVGSYTFYLYLNIRQLFKGIIAISKGNYERKIRLIKNIFSPYEIYFLAKEFNFMAKKVSQSYKDLIAKNIELKRQDEFRGSLVSAISHEFRTPLTSIIGYSSRLLRHDIEIDEKTQIKSLKIIKEQAQMLSRMVEDLLVIPEIDSFSLKLDLRPLDISGALEKSMLYVNCKNHQIITEIDENLPLTLGDENRLIQIFVNLLENAIKYSEADSPVKVSSNKLDKKFQIKISNKHPNIDKEILDKLFDKFTRVDSELTRTTRGTGLGLYIVKGLCANMKIDIALKSENNEFSVILTFDEAQ